MAMREWHRTGVFQMLRDAIRRLQGRPTDDDLWRLNEAKSLAEYSRAVRELQDDGFTDWMWSSANPMTYDLVVIKRIGQEGSVVNPRDLPNWFNVAGLWWKPWRPSGRSSTLDEFLKGRTSSKPRVPQPTGDANG